MLELRALASNAEASLQEVTGDRDCLASRNLVSEPIRHTGL
jgi:hypothetical protein